MGGWAFPFGVISTALGLHVLLLMIVRHAALGPPTEPKQADAWHLLVKPPVGICAVVIFTVTLPISLCQPLFEPYLTAAPFNLTPSGVGVVFGLVSIVDSVSAVLTGAWSLLVGQLQLVVLSLFLMLGGCLVLALGPATYGAFLAGCFLTSLGMYPVLITVTAVLLRISRTYGLSPRDFSEVIVSLVVTSLTLSSGVGSIFLGGVLGDFIGLRATYLICGFIVAPLPLLFLSAVHPIIIGRPLAPLASDDLKATYMQPQKQPDSKQVEYKQRARAMPGRMPGGDHRRDP